MNQQITIPSIKKISEEANAATFVIEPLFPGYGVTIGNSLRRVLLSSLSGAAPYAVKIEGVSHEFSTIPGIKEDVIQILLNLKKLNLKIFEGDEASLKLDVRGPKEVKAVDFKVPSNVEIVNTDQKIATLGARGKLKLELRVDKGLGYVPVERREEEKKELGVIALDSYYSPVKKVHYEIENTRVGRYTNYDKLTLQITTDGTITPELALEEAGKILLSHFDLIAQTRKSLENSLEKEVKSKAKSPQELKKQKIEDVGFSNRTTNVLLANNIKTISGLLKVRREKLTSLKGLGIKSREEIEKKLKKWGLELK